MRAIEVMIWIRLKLSDQNSTVHFASMRWAIGITSNILHRNSAVTISVCRSHENNRVHLELWQQWKIWPRCFWHENLYHRVHAQVLRWCQCQISYPKNHLRIFWCEYLVIPWNQWSAPWAVAAVKILTTLSLTTECVSLSACTSAVMMSVSNILSQNPSGNILVWISCYPMKTTECTLSCGSSEKLDSIASDIITECMYKCSNDVSVEYLVPKTICKYFSMHITQKKWSTPWAVAAVKNWIAQLVT